MLDEENCVLALNFNLASKVYRLDLAMYAKFSFPLMRFSEALHWLS